MTTSKQQLRTDTVLDIKLDPNSGPSKALFKSVGDISKAGFREIPIIDFALSQLDPAEYNRKLITACADVGFLVLQNVPGFEQEFQDQVLGQGHTFFNLPEDVKLQTDIRKSKHLRGSARQDKVKDLRLNINLQAYHFGYEQPECTDPAAPLWKRILNGSNQWPDKKVLPKFRTIIEEYHRRCEHLGRTLGKQICRALGADEKYFTRYFDDVADPTDLYFLGTLNYYPSFHEIPVERRQEVEEGFVRGMYAHRDDQSWITMLIQDAPGLEVLSHDGNWVDVPVLPGSVVVNLGLVLSDATGGALQATTHRVNSMKVTKNRMTAPCGYPKIHRVVVLKSSLFSNPLPSLSFFSL